MKGHRVRYTLAKKPVNELVETADEKNSVAIALNVSLGGWTKTFTDSRICAAIVDRLIFGATSSSPEPSPATSPRPEAKLSEQSAEWLGNCVLRR